MLNTNTIGKRIKSLRTSKKLTLEEVGKFLGVGRATVQRYESGIISGIPSDKIELMAKLYNVSPGYIMGWDNCPTTNTKNLISKITQIINEKPDFVILFETAITLPPEKVKTAICIINQLKDKK